MHAQFFPVPHNYNYLPITHNEAWLANCTAKFYIVDINNQLISTGTGFHIGNGYFMTAGHCFRPGSNFSLNFSRVLFQNGHQYNLIGNNLISGLQYGLDFAIVRFNNSLNEPHVILNYDINVNNLLGQQMIITHHPLGDDIMRLSAGIINNMDHGNAGDGYANIAHLAMWENPNCFRYNPATIPGSSGAPIGIRIHNQNVVIGVHVRGDDVYQDFHAATKMSAINQNIMLRFHGISLNQFIGIEPVLPIPHL